MVTGTGTGTRYGLAAASALAMLTLAACRGTGEGKIGMSVRKEVPVLGVVSIEFEQGWEFGAVDPEVCGCLVFLGPDGHPLDGAAVGQIRNGVGGGPIPEGAVGWRAMLTREDCDSLDCSELLSTDGPGGTAVSLAAAWLAAPIGPQESFVLLGSRLLDDDARAVHSDVGDWERASFLDLSATVMAPDVHLAWAMVELSVEAGPRANLSQAQRAALEQRVTIHEAVRLEMEGPEFAPVGFQGAVIRTGAPFGAQVLVNGASAAAGASQAPTLPGELPTVHFALDLGLVDYDPTWSAPLANRMMIRSKRTGEPVTTTRLSMTLVPTDG